MLGTLDVFFHSVVISLSLFSVIIETTIYMHTQQLMGQSVEKAHQFLCDKKSFRHSARQASLTAFQYSVPLVFVCIALTAMGRHGWTVNAMVGALPAFFAIAAVLWYIPRLFHDFEQIRRRREPKATPLPDAV